MTTRSSTVPSPIGPGSAGTAKNANLLLPGAGSWFVLGSIVTTAEYEPTPGPAVDGCGTCTRCIDECPTGAIIHAPGVIDANRCISWILQKPGSIPDEYRRAIGDRIYGCDDCQGRACPISVRLGRRNTIELDDRADAWVDAIELLDADDDWIDARYGHWYVTNREFRWVRRNALIVIGNVGPRAMHAFDGWSSTTVPTSTRSCPNMPAGPPTASANDPGRARRREAPAGHE